VTTTNDRDVVAHQIDRRIPVRRFLVGEVKWAGVIRPTFWSRLNPFIRVFSCGSAA